MLIPGLEAGKLKKDAQWVILPQSRKMLQKNDLYVLGDVEVNMPPIVSTSNIKGIKMRLVEEVNTPLAKPTDKAATKVVKEWEFTEDNQTMPISFDVPLRFQNTLWIEALNPTNNDGNINAQVHGMYRSRAL